jgi:signal transduction histidine kinase
VDESGGFGLTVRRWRTPLTVAVAVALAVLVAMPFSGVRGPEVTGFSAAWCAVVLLCDLLTTVLLVGLYRNGRGLRMLALATAFAWSAVIVVLLALAIPGVTGSDPLLADDQAIGWLYVSRHAGPPVLIALALAPWPTSWEARSDTDSRIHRRALLAAVAVLVLGPGSIALEVSAFPEILPRVVDPITGHLTPLAYTLVLVTNMVSVLVALAGVSRRGDRSGVEVWAIVAAFAWLGDVGFVGMHQDRFTVAWYGARLLGVTAALIVPASILVHIWRLHQRVTAGAEDLEAQVDRLLESQRLRDHVAAVVSHDMRTPLAGLGGYLEVLVEDEDLDPELARRMLERSVLLTRRLTLLSEDLLAATTLEHVDLVVRPDDLDLQQQLAECASGFPELDLRIHCPDGIRVYADPLRLQQILTNLVRNAEKHGAEPVSIDVSTSVTEVTIRVRDEGEGVPASFIPRLFERYTQGARAAGGAGIGLSVVHDLVRAHHGTVRYDHTEPAFVVTLPRAQPSPDTSSGPYDEGDGWAATASSNPVGGGAPTPQGLEG